MWLNAFFQAIKEIRRNSMRSLLTAIGIVIGIASVIAMVNIGKGASQSITESVSRLGGNTLFIMPGQEHGPGQGSSATKSFSLKDIEVLKESIFMIKAISPQAGASLTALHMDQSYQTSVRGIDNDYFIIQNWSLAKGDKFSKDDLKSGKNVCILGQTVVDELALDSDNLIGANIRLEKFSCKVVGLLEKKGADTFGQDQDDTILVPIKMLQRRISGNNDVQVILAAIKENFSLEDAKMQIEQILREQRHVKAGDEDNFSVRSMTSLLDTLNQVTGMLTIMLGAVAAISLVVGGIGIMNIMLVSVTERTREIGIRMAIGAMAKDIMTQFLIESTVLSAVGGILGVLFGLVVTFAVSFALDITLIIDPSIIVVALLFSMLIGIVFGLVPARKAANMNPIDALRYE